MLETVRRALHSILISGVSVVSCWGCSSAHEPCPGAVVGAQYELIVGEALEGESGDCLAPWGFQKGSITVAHVVRTEGRDDCSSGDADLTVASGWTLARQSPSGAGGGGLIESKYSISNEECSSTLSLSLSCRSSCVPTDEAACECRLYVGVDGLNGCPATCRVIVTASVSKS